MIRATAVYFWPMHAAVWQIVVRVPRHRLAAGTIQQLRTTWVTFDGMLSEGCAASELLEDVCAPFGGRR
jgi:hypothetical protein